jgi:hypothetical protein
MLTINISYTGCIVSMPIARSKRKLIAAATALFIVAGALTATIGAGGLAATVFASTTPQGNATTTTGQPTEEPQQRPRGGGGGGETILQQGTISSVTDPLPGHEAHQAAMILPPREDSVYAGTLTYTATEPVEVIVLHIQNLNNTEQQILNTTSEEIGTIYSSQLDNETSVAISVITPNYGDTPFPSTSIPFAGNALLLHTTDGTPFAATYTVEAVVQQPETVNSISNITASEEEAAAAEEEAAAAEEEAAAAEEEAAAAEEEAAADGNGNTTEIEPPGGDGA